MSGPSDRGTSSTRTSTGSSGARTGAGEPVPSGSARAARPDASDARRRAARTRLYVWAGAIILLVVLLIAFVVANTESVTVDWLVTSASLSLVWVIFGSAVIGWLLGIATSVIFRRRTRAGRPATPSKAS